MPTFITLVSYTEAGVKGLLDKPEDRTAAIDAILAPLGGKVTSLYMTTGQYDAVVIYEAPDRAACVALAMATRGAGAVASLETAEAWTGAEFAEIAAKGAGLRGSYTPPG